ncbi:MAG: hypothetical protein ACM3ML_23570 [Micromonosporaceae bacterium]
MVNIDARDAERAMLATHLNTRCDAELLIPAVSARETVTLTMEYVALRDVIDGAGLVVADPRRLAR